MLSFGLFYYWISWLIWIIVTFFMKTEKTQQLLIISILILIIVANKYYTVGHFQISTAYSLILFGSWMMFRILKRHHYHLMISFTIMIGYSGITIWKNATPLWLFFPDLLFIPIFCSLIIFMLTKGLAARLLTVILGLCTGELFSSFIFTSYDMYQIIGDFHFLDQLSVTILFILFIHFMQQLIYLSYQFLNEYRGNSSSNIKLMKG